MTTARGAPVAPCAANRRRGGCLRRVASSRSFRPGTPPRGFYVDERRRRTRDARRRVDNDGAGLTRSIRRGDADCHSGSASAAAAAASIAMRIEEQRPVADHLAPHRCEARGWTKQARERRGSARWRTSRWIRTGMRSAARPSHATGLRQIISAKGRMAAARILPGPAGAAGRTAQQEFAEAFVERGVGHQQR